VFDVDKNGKIDRKCKLCNAGELSLKNSFKGGAFIGCSNYPECKFTRPLSKAKAAEQSNLSEPKLIGKNDQGKDIFLKNGRFGPYLQFEMESEENKKVKKRKSKKKNLDNLKNVSIPKGITIDSIDLDKAKFLCALPKNIGTNPENQKEITLNSGRFGPIFFGNAHKNLALSKSIESIVIPFGIETFFKLSKFFFLDFLFFTFLFSSDSISNCK
jgi:DNA topoisomerase-1